MPRGMGKPCTTRPKYKPDMKDKVSSKYNCDSSGAQPARVNVRGHWFPGHLLASPQIKRQHQIQPMVEN